MIKRSPKPIFVTLLIFVFLGLNVQKVSAGENLHKSKEHKNFQKYNKKIPFKKGTPTKRTITINGLKRTYYYYLPSSYNENPIPVLLILHPGLGSAAKSYKDRTNIEYANKNEFCLVYPEGIGKNWNVHESIVPGNPQHQGKNRPKDVLFMKKILQELEQDLNINKSRIFSMGMSAGGLMSYRLACEGITNAMAAVAANMPEALVSDCKPKKPLSVLSISGTEDTAVPYAKGDASIYGLDKTLISAPESVNFWASKNGCSLESTKSNLPDINKNDHSTVSQEIFTRCAHNAGVIFYTVHGGGHTWPRTDLNNIQARITKLLLGNVNRDFDALEVIFDFFGQH